MQSIIIPVFSLTWPFRNHSNIKTFLIIINAENFLNISFNIFVESVIFPPPPPKKLAAFIWNKNKSIYCNFWSTYINKSINFFHWKNISVPCIYKHQ